ncbi:DUF2793 domain-containing protein [Sphingomonas sp. Leaf412]|uniref:DUF2793 domain-containing protein n=1 Tax=Sphingomonas sp. Leaf412 TaxID=1736370 RepID=UPI001F2C08E6|nr:DUF2793 domain-containing protein [Sphingomonas sp. Leaf412]
MVHNEALALLDIAAQAVVEAVGPNAPPPDPAVGACWIVGPEPTGAWGGHAGAIAGFTAGGWRFLAARDGMRAWSRADDRTVARVDGAWEDGLVRCRRLLVEGQRVVAARQPAIASPTGGSTVDTEARTAIGQVLDALRTHGLISID